MALIDCISCDRAMATAVIKDRMDRGFRHLECPECRQRHAVIRRNGRMRIFKSKEGARSPHSAVRADVKGVHEAFEFDTREDAESVARKLTEENPAELWSVMPIVGKD